MIFDRVGIKVGAQRALPSDPDHAIFRRASRNIALQVAALSAVMVAAGALLLFAYMWFEAEVHGKWSTRPRAMEVELGAEDVVEALLVVGTGVVLLAGLGALLFARRAVAPLEESMRRQRDFVGDASHELRTPLAVLLARSQQLEYMVGQDPALRPVVAELRADAKTLSYIVDDMLASVSQSAGVGPPADLDVVVGEVLETMSVLAQERGVRLKGKRVGNSLGPAANEPRASTVDDASSSSSQVLVCIPAVPLRRSLTALVDNAIGHTPAGGTVTVSVLADSKWATIRVADEGGGIAGIRPDDVFRRFSHGAQVSVHGSPRSSHGLGLALVRDVVTRSGGSVEVESTGKNGTVFALRVPTAGGVRR